MSGVDRDRERIRQPDKQDNLDRSVIEKNHLSKDYLNQNLAQVSWSNLYFH